MRRGDDPEAFLTILMGTTPFQHGVGVVAWLVLIVAGLFEIGWAVGLKFTEGFTRLWPTLGTLASMIISIGLLGLALKSLPLGTALCRLDWRGHGRDGLARHGAIPRAC
jgi:quaternary ammonium compound-resistance protein SugE